MKETETAKNGTYISHKRSAKTKPEGKKTPQKDKMFAVRVFLLEQMVR